MGKILLFQLQVLTVLLFASCAGEGGATFTLSNGGKTASVYILPGEPEFVHLAVNDLLTDVEKITGSRPEIVTRIEGPGADCMVIGTAGNAAKSELMKKMAGSDLENLKSKWEAYRIRNYTSDRNFLLITGSDPRGTMFGIYHFIEEYLGVDPMYYWTDREPETAKKLAWKGIDLFQDEPSFKYRGWFINDEDLLTEWKESGGPRYIDYPFYGQVANPEIMERAVEALVRLRYNLIIPASFIDIMNPPEKKLVDIAAKRGVFLSMHHVEPMGVSGFTFMNYWKEKGKEYKFSYYSNPDALKEVWQVYAEKWAEYPDLIWQTGLRGFGDRPMWQADPGVPDSDSLRGKIISDAMQVQMEIIRSVDKREEIPVTTTLWMEGASLHKGGYLRFPEGVMVIFADNSPGWIMQPDFYETEREPSRQYGFYYHHALWGTGPHLVQGVSPAKAFEIAKLAADHFSDHYAVLNVSNIREFPMGLEASSKMLYNLEGFDPGSFLTSWCSKQFGKASKEVEAVYRQFFDNYKVHGEKNMVYLLDGQMRSRGLALMKIFKNRMNDPEKQKKEEIVLSDGMAGKISFTDLARDVEEQKEGLINTGAMAGKVKKKLSGLERTFFEVNFIAQQQILLGINTWLDALIKAIEAEEKGDRATCVASLENAVNAFSLIHSGKEMASRGEKWQHWYRGDKKMNLDSVEESTKELLASVKSADTK